MIAKSKELAPIKRELMKKVKRMHWTPLPEAIAEQYFGGKLAKQTRMEIQTEFERWLQLWLENPGAKIGFNRVLRGRVEIFHKQFIEYLIGLSHKHGFKLVWEISETNRAGEVPMDADGNDVDPVKLLRSTRELYYSTFGSYPPAPYWPQKPQDLAGYGRVAIH